MKKILIKILSAFILLSVMLMASGRDNAASGGTGNVIADQDNDNDNDNDSVTDDKDNCPAMANPDQLDTDADLLCDVVDDVDVLPLDQ